MGTGARARGLACWSRGRVLARSVSARQVAAAKVPSAYTGMTARSVSVAAQSATARCARHESRFTRRFPLLSGRCSNQSLAKHNRKPSQLIENNHHRPKSIASFCRVFLDRPRSKPAPEPSAECRGANTNLVRPFGSSLPVRGDPLVGMRQRVHFGRGFGYI